MADENREPYGRHDPDMDLPPGKTCGDCAHFRRCNLIFGHIAADESCDWAPSRFRVAPSPTTEVMAELKPCPFCGGEGMAMPRTCDKKTRFGMDGCKAVAHHPDFMARPPL